MIGRLTGKLAFLAPLLLRITLGVVFVFHGSQKLFGLFEGDGMEKWKQGVAAQGVPNPDVMATLAALGEFVGGLCVLLGLLTRYAALGLCAIMAGAAWYWHGLQEFFQGTGTPPFSNQHQGFEYPFVLFMVALTLVLTGGGRVSIDRAMSQTAI